MIVQLMSNPIVFSRNLQSFPLCQTIEPSFAQSAKTALAPIIDLSRDAADPTAKKTKVCRMDGCDDEAARRTPYCKKHADRDVVNLQGVRNVRKAGLGSASVMVEEDAANLMDARKEHETRNFAHLTEAGGVATLTLAPN